MKHDGNISSDAAAERVQIFFIMHFVIVRSQENVLLYLEMRLIIVGLMGLR